MPDPALNKTSTPYRRRQLYAMPVVIVLGAVLFAWWSAHQESARRSLIQAELHGACGAIIREVDPGDSGLAGRLKAFEGLHETLRVMLESVAGLKDVVIEVETGDTSPFGDGSATHTALIIIDDRSRLGIRLLFEDESQVDIIGYWLPDAG